MDQAQFKYLKRFITYLKKNHPIKRKGVVLDIKLVPEATIPFKYQGSTIEARATFGIRAGRTTIKIAVGDLFKSPKDIMHDLSHEVYHAIQYWDLNDDFQTAASSWYEDPREIAAEEFADRVVAEYLRELGIEE